MCLISFHFHTITLIVITHYSSRRCQRTLSKWQPGRPLRHWLLGSLTQHDSYDLCAIGHYLYLLPYAHMTHTFPYI